jgi:DNA-binding IclR family transcriptional regulator
VSAALTSPNVEPSRFAVESVVRALRLLDCFERGRPELPLAEFVRRSGYSKSTTYRLLMTLESAGWLERGAGGTFRLTIKAFQVGSILVDSLELRHEAAPIMARMAAELDQTIYLVVASGSRAVCLERIDGGQEVLVADLYVGGSQSLHLGAAPRALLAFDETALLPAVLADGLAGKTERTITDRARLLEDLAQTRERGYSISDEDVTRGVAAIGAPVFGAEGQAVAAMSVGGLLPQILPPTAALLDSLLGGCADVSARLGHRPP